MTGAFAAVDAASTAAFATAALPVPPRPPTATAVAAAAAASSARQAATASRSPRSPRSPHSARSPRSPHGQSQPSAFRARKGSAETTDTGSGSDFDMDDFASCSEGEDGVEPGAETKRSNQPGPTTLAPLPPTPMRSPARRFGLMESTFPRVGNRPGDTPLCELLMPLPEAASAGSFARVVVARGQEPRGDKTILWYNEALARGSAAADLEEDVGWWQWMQEVVGQAEPAGRAAPSHGSVLEYLYTMASHVVSDLKHSVEVFSHRSSSERTALAAAADRAMRCLDVFLCVRTYRQLSVEADPVKRVNTLRTIVRKAKASAASLQRPSRVRASQPPWSFSLEKLVQHLTLVARVAENERAWFERSLLPKDSVVLVWRVLLGQVAAVAAADVTVGELAEIVLGFLGFRDLPTDTLPVAQPRAVRWQQENERFAQTTAQAAGEGQDAAAAPSSGGGAQFWTILSG